MYQSLYPHFHSYNHRFFFCLFKKIFAMIFTHLSFYALNILRRALVVYDLTHICKVFFSSLDRQSFFLAQIFKVYVVSQICKVYVLSRICKLIFSIPDMQSLCSIPDCFSKKKMKCNAHRNLPIWNLFFYCTFSSLVFLSFSLPVIPSIVVILSSAWEWND